jgi:hypothetical protein
LYEVSRGHDNRAGDKEELAAGQLILPGGVGVSKHGKVYVSTPVFGPGSVLRVK